jgi:predicted transposase/invertase (TIGR01784 family)
VAILRQSIVDILCKDNRGNSWIVEMQCSKDSAFIKRASAYACSVYLNQRNRSKGSDYGSMRPVIFFAVLDYTLFPSKTAYLSHHKFQDIVTGENDIEDFSFSFLELGKFKKKTDELKTNTEKWAYFFKHAADVTPGELEGITEDYPVIGSAYTALAEYGYTPEELLEYERNDMKDDEIATRLSDAELAGEARGRAEGELKKARETALNLLSMGMDVEQISKATDLSPTDIESLRWLSSLSVLGEA